MCQHTEANERRQTIDADISYMREEFPLKIYIIYTEQMNMGAHSTLLLHVPRIQIQIQKEVKSQRNHKQKKCWVWWKCMRRLNVNRNVEGIKVKLIISAFHCVRCVHIDGVIPQHGVGCCTSYFAIVPFPSRTHRVRVKLIQFNENLMPLNVAGLCGRRYCWLSSSSYSLRLQPNNASLINATSLFTF